MTFILSLAAFAVSSLLFMLCARLARTDSLPRFLRGDTRTMLLALFFTVLLSLAFAGMISTASAVAASVAVDIILSLGLAVALLMAAYHLVRHLLGPDPNISTMKKA